MTKRKQYVIHRRFQWDFTLKIILAILAPSLISGSALLIYLYLHLTPAERALLSVIQWEILVGITWRLFVVLFVTVIFSIFYTHRIAGPIRRMELFCRESATPNHPRRILILRKKDLFRSLAFKLNLIQGAGLPD